MSMMEKVEFVTESGSDEAELRAGDFGDADALAEEVGIFLEDLGDDDVLTISLLPPFGSSFAAPGAVDVIRDVVLAAHTTPRLRFLVASEDVAKKMRPRFDRSVRGPRTVEFGDLSVEIVVDDITEVEVDGIVNASNTRLELGTGVSGAIGEKAGPKLQERLFALAGRRRIKAGHIVVTEGYELEKTNKILHVATASGQPKDVRLSIKNCLRRAGSEDLRSMALPAMGTGTGGLEMAKFAQILLDELQDFGDSGQKSTLEEVIVVLWTAADYEAVIAEVDARE